MSATKVATETIELTNERLLELIKNGDPIANCANTLKALSKEELVSFSMLMLHRIGYLIEGTVAETEEEALVTLIVGINYGMHEYDKVVFDSMAATMTFGNA